MHYSRHQHLPCKKRNLNGTVEIILPLMCYSRFRKLIKCDVYDIRVALLPCQTTYQTLWNAHRDTSHFIKSNTFHFYAQLLQVFKDVANFKESDRLYGRFVCNSVATRRWDPLLKLSAMQIALGQLEWDENCSPSHQPHYSHLTPYSPE